MKNRALYQRPYCRETATKWVSGWSRYFGGKGWSIKWCDQHGKQYEDASTEGTSIVRINGK